MGTIHFEIDVHLKEQTVHRTVDLPIACYHTSIKENSNGYIPLHWHDELQLVVVTNGKVRFHVNNETVIVHEKNGVFINSGSLHMAESLPHLNSRYICLNVDPSFLLPQELFATYVRPYIQATNFPYLYIGADEAWGKNIIDCTLSIHRSIEEQPPYYEIDVTTKVMAIWKLLISNGLQLEYDQNKMMQNRRVKGMLQWIHNHYEESISLDDIAKVGQLSRSECCRYFKRMLKTSPLQYVTDYRIQKSLPLLQQPNATVTDVAYQVGFNSTSYFIARFRKVMNMTPLAYKKSKLNDVQ